MHRYHLSLLAGYHVHSSSSRNLFDIYDGEQVASEVVFGGGGRIFGEEFVALSQSAEVRLLSSDSFSIKLEVSLELDE